MYRRNRIALMVGLVSLLLVAVFLFSSCVAADGTVYGLQPVTANMMAANKQFILDYFTALNQDKSPATVDKYVADEVLKHHIDLFETAFPGYQLTAKEMIAEGDTVFVRAGCTGVHNGDMSGIAPTGKSIDIEIALTYRIADGKIVDHWMLFDQLTVLQQIGVMPTP
ncbi:MAG: ester cyclase [Caldilineaceae bacterium]